MQVVFSRPAPAEGLHDLRPVGPWPLPGTVPARNGRLPWLWACSRCGRSAGDSSRAKELARKPCGGSAWQLAEANHSLELVNGGWRCSRCLLRVRPQHTAQTERQACPVGEFTSGEGRWARPAFGSSSDACGPSGTSASRRRSTRSPRSRDAGWARPPRRRSMLEQAVRVLELLPGAEPLVPSPQGRGRARRSSSRRQGSPLASTPWRRRRGPLPEGLSSSPAGLPVVLRGLASSRAAAF